MKNLCYDSYQVLASGGIRNPDFGTINNFPFFSAWLNVFVIAHFFGIVNSSSHFVTFSSKNRKYCLDLCDIFVIIHWTYMYLVSHFSSKYSTFSMSYLTLWSTEHPYGILFLEVLPSNTPPYWYWSIEVEGGCTVHKRYIRCLMVGMS